MDRLKFNDYKESKYIYTGEFHEELALVKNRENKYGYINKKGQEAISCQYKDATDFSEGLAAVQNENGLWGYINKNGEEVIPCQFKAADRFSEGLAAVQTNSGGFVYIDKNGLQAMDREYEYASNFNEGYAVVRQRGSNLYNYLDKSGNHHGRYLDASHFINGIAMIRDDENIYIINKTFEEHVLKTIRIKGIMNISICNNGMILIKDGNEKYGYLSKTFEEKIPCSFRKTEGFSEGVAIIDLSEEWHGFISEEGVITAFSKEYQYKEIKNFFEGLAAVQNQQGLWGYINKKGKEVIPCQFKAADRFSEGLAGVIDIDGTLHYIDKKGKKNITLDNIYYSSLELKDKVITIKADSQQELAIKKLKVLSIAKEEIIKNTIDMIDDLAYTETSTLYKPQTRKKKYLIKSNILIIRKNKKKI